MDESGWASVSDTDDSGDDGDNVDGADVEADCGGRDEESVGRGKAASCDSDFRDGWGDKATGVGDTEGIQGDNSGDNKRDIHRSYSACSLVSFFGCIFMARAVAKRNSPFGPTRPVIDAKVGVVVSGKRGSLDVVSTLVSEDGSRVDPEWEDTVLSLPGPTFCTVSMS